MMGAHRQGIASVVWPALVASGLALLGGCAGCACGGSAGGGDGGKEAPIVDTSVDIGVDVGVAPDQGKKVTCGGTRTLNPVTIQPGPAQRCGPGCRQISWGYAPDHRFEVAKDLLA